MVDYKNKEDLNVPGSVQTQACTQTGRAELHDQSWSDPIPSSWTPLAHAGWKSLVKKKREVNI